ncbi:MAG: hypothetical protein WD066_09005 [Planctomycetaceae bacterium]
MTTCAMTTRKTKSWATKLWRDEAGFVVSAELVLILTLGVLAIIVGVHGVASAVNNEMADVSSAFGTVDQSFMVTGFRHGGFGFGGLHSFKSGSGFIDRADFCDCAVITQVSSGAKFGGIGGGGVGVIGGGSVSGATPAPAMPAPAPIPMDCPPGTFPAIPCPPGAVPHAAPSVPCDDCFPTAPHVPSLPPLPPLPVPEAPFSR